MLSLLLLQVGGIITLVEEEGGPFPAPWKNSVSAPKLDHCIQEGCHTWIPGSCQQNGCLGRGTDVGHPLLPIRAGVLLLSFSDMPE